MMKDDRDTANPPEIVQDAYQYWLEHSEIAKELRETNQYYGID